MVPFVRMHPCEGVREEIISYEPPALDLRAVSDLLSRFDPFAIFLFLSVGV